MVRGALRTKNELHNRRKRSLSIRNSSRLAAVTRLEISQGPINLASMEIFYNSELKG